jgi:phage terminase large subunit-like protein
MASRRQPIIYHITTAGVNVTSACKNYEDVCFTVLDGINENDHLLIMVHDMDEDDDWQDKNTWQKANPNLGVTVDKSFLLKEFHKVKNQPSKIPTFKTKHLNMWVDAPEIWIPDEIWQKGNAPIKIENFTTFGCYGGVDLSTTTDISAFILLSEPDDDGIRDILPYFFCPKDTIEIRSKEDRVPYRLWMDQGHMIATPGNVIDYAEIKKVIQQAHQNHKIINIEFDKWNASQLVAELQELVVPVSYFSQAIATFSYPTKQFEKLVFEGKIRNGGNPVLRWMLSGCSIIQDANENIKVHKGRSHAGKKRVDGIIATIMALGGSLSVEDNSKVSKYNNEETEINFGV